MRHGPAALALLLLADAPAWACTACACGDPTIATLGTERPMAGATWLGLQGAWRAERDRAAAAVADELRVDLTAAWAPHDRVQLVLLAPLVTRSITDASLATTRSFGLGDVGVAARFLAAVAEVQGDGGRSTRLSAGPTVAVDLPTAPRLRADLAHELWLGTGALTGALGGFFQAVHGPVSVWASGELRASVLGRDGRRPGLAGRGSAFVQGQPLPQLGLRAGVDWRASRADLLGAGGERARDPETGGWLVAITPALVAAPTPVWSLLAGVAVPVAGREGSGLREGPRPFLAVRGELPRGGRKALMAQSAAQATP